MDIGDVRVLVQEMMRRTLDDIRDSKRCPRCGKETTMLKVWVEDTESEDELAEDIVKWRCLNCLGLFSEELKET